MIPLRLVVAGAGGRMGQALIKAILSTPDLMLNAVLDKPGSALVGRSLSDLAISPSALVVDSKVEAVLPHTDVFIDFTAPEATSNHIKACVEHHIPMVIGTTGLVDAILGKLLQATQEIGVVYSPNFSLGVNAMLKLLALSAQILQTDYAVEIIEAHHKDKIDAPSGTALAMGQVVAQALGRNLEECAVYNRQALHQARDPDVIGFSSIRAGDIVGEHAVWFVGDAERIEITHKAYSRQPLVRGALRAARWIAHHPAGLYSMQDVLSE